MCVMYGSPWTLQFEAEQERKRQLHCCACALACTRNVAWAVSAVAAVWLLVRMSCVMEYGLGACQCAQRC
jgi:hypothetical protein